MKDIKNYEGRYAITEDGKVWSYKRQQYLKPTDNGVGYLKVLLYKDGKGKNHYIHRLIAETYIPNPDNLPQINHINENKRDNSISNLEWCSCKDNINHGTHNERSAIGHYKKVYCVELNKVFESLTAAAEATGLSKCSVSNVCNGRRKSCYGYHFSFVPEA